MAIRYLLDTNIISYLTDPNSPYRERVKAHLMALSSSDTVSVSIITLYELSYGLHSYRNTPESVALFRKGISFIETYLDVLPLHIREVDIFGDLKARYKEATGIHNRANKKNDLDFLIAATAISHDAVLISHDTIFERLFGIVPQLRHQDWLG